MKFSIKDLLSKCDQIRRKLRIRSHILKKSLMENFIFCAVNCIIESQLTESLIIITNKEVKLRNNKAFFANSFQLSPLYELFSSAVLSLPELVVQHFLLIGSTSETLLCFQEIELSIVTFYFQDIEISLFQF